MVPLLPILAALAAAPAGAAQVIPVSFVTGQRQSPHPVAAPWAPALSAALPTAGPELGALAALEPSLPQHQAALVPLVRALEARGLTPEGFLALPSEERRARLVLARLAARSAALVELRAGVDALRTPDADPERDFGLAASLLGLMAAHAPYLAPGELAPARAAVAAASARQGDAARRRVLDAMTRTLPALLGADFEAAAEAVAARALEDPPRRPGALAAFRRREPVPSGPRRDNAYLYALMTGVPAEEAARLPLPAPADGLHPRYAAALDLARLEARRRGPEAGALFLVEASAPLAAEGPEDWALAFFLLRDKHARWGARLDIRFEAGSDPARPVPVLSAEEGARLPEGWRPFPADAHLLALGVKFSLAEVLRFGAGAATPAGPGARVSLRAREDLETGAQDLHYHFSAGGVETARANAREGGLKLRADFEPREASFAGRVERALGALLPPLAGSTAPAWELLPLIKPAGTGALFALRKLLSPGSIFLDPALGEVELKAELAKAVALRLARAGRDGNPGAAEALRALVLLEEGRPSPPLGPEPQRLLDEARGWAARTGRPDDAWGVLRALLAGGGR